MKKQPGTALTWYEKVTSGSQVLDSYVRRARVLASLKRLPEARELLATLREQYPPLSSRLIATEGELLIQEQAFIEALSLYDAALKADPGDEELLYARALLHERMNRFDLSEADLKAIIEQGGIKLADDLPAQGLGRQHLDRCAMLQDIHQQLARIVVGQLKHPSA